MENEGIGEVKTRHLGLHEVVLRKLRGYTS
jgi:hypothetical protein